jgi:hypothetical protein
MYRSLCVLAFLTLAAPLPAGQIFGTLTESGKAVAAGVEISIDCAGEQVKTATDKFGAYRLNPQKTGRCSLTLTYKGQALSVTVASLAAPVAADFELQVQDGKYKLVRK